jgi:heat shock protein HslJ
MGASSMVAAGSKAALLALCLAACTSIAADQRTFEGTRWHVASVNGRSTPATGDYSMQFANGQMSGRFGCNHFGGPYSTSRDLLVARDVASTLMGCPEPAASFERDGFAILQLPMRMDWGAEGSLTLSNTAGSIGMERVP